MEERYLEWIAANVPADPTGMCREISEQMSAAFSELKRVRGHYQFSQHERPWTHWWLVAPDGEIVDPTVAQWPDFGTGRYIAHDESGPEPMGKCPNCGGYCYDGNTCCSAKCHTEYRAYVMGDMK